VAEELSKLPQQVHTSVAMNAVFAEDKMPLAL
jgi:hypothetical protein